MLNPPVYKVGDVIVAHPKKTSNPYHNSGMIQRVGLKNEYYLVHWFNDNRFLEISFFAAHNYFCLKQDPNDIIRELL